MRIEYVEDFNEVSEQLTNIENSVISLINNGIEQMSMVEFKGFYKSNGSIIVTVMIQSIGEYRTGFNCKILTDEARQNDDIKYISSLTKMFAFDILEMIREEVLRRIEYKPDNFQELAEKYIKLDQINEEIKVYRK